MGRAPLFPVVESRAVLRDERLHLREQLGGAPVHEHERRVVALGHVSEDLEHLVLRRRRLAVLVGAALRLLEVAEPLERRRETRGEVRETRGEVREAWAGREWEEGPLSHGPSVARTLNDGGIAMNFLISR